MCLCKVLEIEGGFSCAKKLARIREELDTNEGISDSDAVLVVDGYDVLFTPIFLRAIMVSPILCLVAENGFTFYSEFSGVTNTDTSLWGKCCIS